MYVHKCVCVCVCKQGARISQWHTEWLDTGCFLRILFPVGAGAYSYSYSPASIDKVKNKRSYSSTPINSPYDGVLNRMDKFTECVWVIDEQTLMYHVSHVVLKLYYISTIPRDKRYLINDSAKLRLPNLSLYLILFVVVHLMCCPPPESTL
jgi:hypothetical protein